MAKAKRPPVSRPNRDPDHYSKRGVPYWWAPEWVRATSADYPISDAYHKQLQSIGETEHLLVKEDGSMVRPADKYGKIKAVKDSNDDVNLYMKAKDGNMSYIQGSIQKEFKQWHADRQIDYILLGIPLDELIDDE